MDPRLRPSLNFAFAPVIRYARAPRAARRFVDFQRAIALPVELATSGIRCAVGPARDGGFGVSITLPATMTGAPVETTVHANGESLLGALMEAHAQLVVRLDRLERDESKVEEVAA